MKIVHHDSIGFIVFQNSQKFKKYLLLEYRGGHFDFVKGHIDETDVDNLATAYRELYEETGIKKADTKFFEKFVYKFSYKYYEDDVLHIKNVTLYLLESFVLDIKLSDEHLSYFWLSYDDAVKKTTYDNAKMALITAEKFLSLN